MGHQLRFRWPQIGTAITVELLDDLNPELTNLLWEALPLRSIQSHAVVAGQQMYFPTRLVLRDPDSAFVEPMHEQPKGRINFEPFFQYLSINYGPISEPVRAWPVGQVVERDISLLPDLGKRVWENLLYSKTALLVIVEHTDVEPRTTDLNHLTEHQGDIALPAAATWQEALAHIQTETDAIWLMEPEDVRALRLGVLASDAGVYGQYFSPWIMVTGLVRSLAVIELAALVRLSHNPDFSVTQLRTMLGEMLTLSVGVIGYFGLPLLGVTLDAVKRTVDQIDEPADFTRLVTALMIYTNRYNLWLHQTFPWHLGMMYPKPSLHDAQGILDLAAKPLYGGTINRSDERCPAPNIESTEW